MKNDNIEYIEYNVDGEEINEYDLVVVHVDKAIRLLGQLVALCDVAIPEVVTYVNSLIVTWMIWIWQ